MIIVLEPGTTADQTAVILAELERLGLRGRPLGGAEKPLIHLIGGHTRAARKLTSLEHVEALVPTSGPRVRKQGRRFYPYHFINLGAIILVLMGGLVCLAGFFPPGVGGAIDPLNPTGHPSVYLPFLTRFLGLFPANLGWLAWLCLLLLLGVVLGLPWLDRTTGSNPRDRWPVLLVAALALLGLLYVTLFKELLG